MKKIALLGATGTVGRFTLEKLLNHPNAKNVRVVLGGRVRAELERLSMEYGRRFKQALDIHQYNIDDRPSLRPIIEPSAVTINCAGPYALTGQAVLGVALNCKVPLIDPSSEAGWLEQVGQRAAAVKEAGICVVSGLGVDPGVAELTAVVGAKGTDVHTVNVLYVMQDLDESPGMRAAVVENLKQPCRAYVERSLQPVKVVGTKHEFKWDGGAMTGKNVPSGDAVLVPRGLPNVRNVNTFRTFEGKHGMLWSMLGSPLASVGMMMMQGWAKGGERPLTDRSRFLVIVELEGAKGRRYAIVQANSFYEKTAALLAEGAMRLCDDEGTKPKGVLSPSQAFGADKLLAAAGLEVQIAEGAPA